MAYIVSDQALGFVDLYLVDTIGPGALKLSGSAIAYGRLEWPGMILRGYDNALKSGGDFMFVQYAGTVTAGGICELTQTADATGGYQPSAQAWAGGANSGKPLAVSMAGGAAGQWGWVQIGGMAVANVSGAPVAGNPVYWQASGVVSPTVVASKQVLNAQFATAPAITYGSGNAAVTLSGTQALLLLNRPCAQGAIT